jgi:hypothetical protein
MEGLDSRGPDTDMSRPGIEPGPPGGEYSCKVLFEQLINSFSENLHMSLRQFFLNCTFVEKFLILSAYQSSSIANSFRIHPK